MGFKTDIEIAQECTMEPITKIAEKAGIDDKYLEQYGKYKAKIDYNLLNESDAPNGKLILVTAINPTPAGEGKTTTTVGLADGMQKLGKNVMVALREPSLGPVFGVKGGAAGGGYAQVVPMEDINLHFTGDFHAIEKPAFTSIGMTDESCSAVFGSSTGSVSQDYLEDTEEIEVVLADREEVKRILKEEHVAIMCSYMLMHFLHDQEPFGFLKEL
ncbi:putative uncharacterized protein [Firmicutes bacterium CAG:424]|nr:putative uncharacterized protein [Firmicutes bacterium CAG:424]